MEQGALLALHYHHDAQYFLLHGDLQQFSILHLISPMLLQDPCHKSFVKS